MALASSHNVVMRRIIDSGVQHRRRIGLFVAATAVVGAATLAIALWLGGDLTQSTINGLVIGGTGNLTGWGLPAAKLVMELASVGVIGMLVTCLLLPAPDGEPSPTLRSCRRTAGRLAVVWAVATAVLLVFTWSDVVDQPVTALPFTKLFTTTTAFPDLAPYVSCTLVAVVIAVGVAVVESRRASLILLLLACYNLVPMALQGHASHGTVLKYSLVVHVIAASLWVGGLGGLLLHVRQQPALLAVAVPRFSTFALGCYIAIAATGITAAWVLLGSIPAVWGSRYGVLVMLKGAALIALGILGWWHRRHTVGRMHTGDDGRARRAFVQLAAAEVVIMVVAVALAVALSRTASPDTIVLHGNQ